MDLKSWNDVVMLPNETWRNGCGDCEDLALFAYSMLAATSRPGESFFLVEIYWGDAGHVGVIAVDASREEKRYYVVDPAGNYFNGIGVYYRVEIIDKRGSHWYYYFSPLKLIYKLKKDLANFTETVYYDYFEKTKHTKPVIYYYSSAFRALHDWIVEYWGAYPLEKIVMVNDKYYKEFDSIVDAAKWLEEHT